MAFLQIGFHSNALGMASSLDAIVPQSQKGPLKVLWLLHGLSDDHTIWQRRTSIERYAEGRNLAVFMPNGARSFYCDIPGGLRYATHIADELPAIAHSMFNLSDRREDTFIAGLSMGGYGAFKLALRHPDRYAAAASFSGVLDIGSFFRMMESDKVADVLGDFGGKNPEGGPEDPRALLAKLVADGARIPRLYQACGTEDFLYADNISFRDFARGLGADLTYEEGPGSHTWLFWDTYIQRAMDWMGL